ncbi:MAG: murein biosynthesis integral membrane protein MurJ, partial [Pseudomonadota bacterium]
AFVPTFTEYDVKRSHEAAWDLANLVIGVLLFLVGSLTLLGMIFTPQVVGLIAPGFGDIPGKGELTVLLARIMFPFLPTIAIAAVFMGMLNSKERFALPAFAPVMFNIVTILAGVGLWAWDLPPRATVIGWSVGTLLGGVAQALIQVPQLVRLGWRWKPKFSGWRASPGLNQIGLLMLPAIVGLSATQINILVNTILASFLQQGSPSWLNYAFRMIQLPIGIFGVAIGVVTLSRVSKDAAKASAEDFRQNLTTSLNLVLLLTLPSAVGLWVLGVPIIRLIYEHGAFTSSDTIATAGALSFYAIGLPSYAAVKVLAPAFYALKDARSPMIASVAAMLMNVGFNVAMYRRFGYQGLAFGTSLAATTNILLLFYWFQRRHHGLPLGLIGKRLAQFGVATAAMAFAAWKTYQALHGIGAGLSGAALETFVPILVAIVTYGAVLALFRVPEAQLASTAIKQIFARFRPAK